MEDGDDDVALSSLQHVVFCARQAALIHVEQLWADDAATTEGTLLHERTDDPGYKTLPGVVLVRAMALASRRLRARGRADMVELRADTAAPKGQRPFPVEMKRGRIKNQLADQVQLCAQAYCLEEMFGVPVERGALFYGKSHRRVEVVFDEELRATTMRAADLMRSLVRAGKTPPAIYEQKKCDACSLMGLCLPRVTQVPSLASRTLARIASVGGGQ